jgi:hypothetical protein
MTFQQRLCSEFSSKKSFFFFFFFFLGRFVATVNISVGA